MMFDHLVVSTQQRRKHVTARYFFGTGALYVLAIAGALASSVLFTDPKLADTDRLLSVVGPPLAPSSTERPRTERGPSTDSRSHRSDPRIVRSLDEILRQRDRGAPPTITQVFNGVGSDLDPGGPPGTGGDGVIGGTYRTIEPPPAPASLPPRPRPSANTTAADNRPVRLPSVVLQGKAIERRTPAYPRLAQQIRQQGDVAVEVIISPDGKVESARVVSGHPMFAQVAREAALGWRFQPTLLNNVPVRVTGVIVFVFKLNE